MFRDHLDNPPIGMAVKGSGCLLKLLVITSMEELPDTEGTGGHIRRGQCILLLRAWCVWFEMSTAYCSWFLWDGIRFTFLQGVEMGWVAESLARTTFRFRFAVSG